MSGPPAISFSRVDARPSGASVFTLEVSHLGASWAVSRTYEELEALHAEGATRCAVAFPGRGLVLDGPIAPPYPPRRVRALEMWLELLGAAWLANDDLFAKFDAFFEFATHDRPLPRPPKKDADDVSVLTGDPPVVPKKAPVRLGGTLAADDSSGGNLRELDKVSLRRSVTRLSRSYTRLALRRWSRACVRMERAAFAAKLRRVAATCEAREVLRARESGSAAREEEVREQDIVLRAKYEAMKRSLAEEAAARAAAEFKVQELLDAGSKKKKKKQQQQQQQQGRNSGTPPRRADARHEKVLSESMDHVLGGGGGGGGGPENYDPGDDEEEGPCVVGAAGKKDREIFWWQHRECAAQRDLIEAELAAARRALAASQAERAILLELLQAGDAQRIHEKLTAGQVGDVEALIEAERTRRDHVGKFAARQRARPASAPARRRGAGLSASYAMMMTMEEARTTSPTRLTGVRPRSATTWAKSSSRGQQAPVVGPFGECTPNGPQRPTGLIGSGPYAALPYDVDGTNHIPRADLPQWISSTLARRGANTPQPEAWQKEPAFPVKMRKKPKKLKPRQVSFHFTNAYPHNNNSNNKPREEVLP